MGASCTSHDCRGPNCFRRKTGPLCSALHATFNSSALHGTESFLGGHWRRRDASARCLVGGGHLVGLARPAARACPTPASSPRRHRPRFRARSHCSSHFRARPPPRVLALAFARAAARLQLWLRLLPCAHPRQWAPPAQAEAEAKLRPRARLRPWLRPSLT